MAGRYTVPLKTVMQDMKLKSICIASDYESAVLTTSDVNRPAM